MLISSLLLSLPSFRISPTASAAASKRRRARRSSYSGEATLRVAGRGPSQPAPRFVGNVIAFLLNLIGPKGLEFARYSLDYHTIRNYLHVNRAWGKQRAAQHIPSYAKKIVEAYDKDGCIESMLQ